jgi:enoyl-CoA hydratase/carnithine racemase
MAKPVADFPFELPPSLAAERRGEIALLRLARAQKRNALDDDTVAGIEIFFTALPDDIRAVVVHGEGDHFCAGLDLSELSERDVSAGIAHSRLWHRAFERVEFGKVPVVSVLHGAVVGGGLFYALPEGSRGIFVGGGGSVRVPRLIGVARMMDMMLTGRTYDAAEGQAMGISHYLVEPGAGLAKALELAQRIAANAPFTNFAVTQVLPRIAESDRAAGYMTEALISSIAQADEEAKERIKAFLDKSGPKVVPR